jgi:predicted membrane protein
LSAISFIGLFARLIYVIFFALIVWMIARARKIGAGYKKSFQLGIHLITLSTIINTLLFLFFPSMQIPLLFTAIAVVMALASMVNLARALPRTEKGAQTLATSPKFEVTLRKAYGFGSMVMGMIPFDGQSAVFAFPGATMGAMGASAMSKSRKSDEDEAAMLRDRELKASYGVDNVVGCEVAVAFLVAQIQACIDENALPSSVDASIACRMLTMGVLGVAAMRLSDRMGPPPQVDVLARDVLNSLLDAEITAALLGAADVARHILATIESTRREEQGDDRGLLDLALVRRHRGGGQEFAQEQDREPLAPLIRTCSDIYRCGTA